MNDITKTPRELECKKKYLYEHSMFWECNDGSKCQILEEDVCDLLNELNKEFEDCEKLLDSKDDFIHKFKRDIEELGISIKLFEDDIATKDKKIEEQQSTIRRLQDLCGESDGENAKLRIENKKLKDDLHNCRLNKNIISEKLKVWQDVHKEYDIYNIKDFEESFKLDAKINKEKDEKIKELEVKVLNLELEIKRLGKMIWKIQWRFQQEVGIEKAREHYREIDKEMEE